MFPEAGEKDAHLWGSVKSVNSDGSYEVQLNTSSVTTRCAAGCAAGVGDRVLVCIMANGRCVAVSRLGGDFGANVFSLHGAFGNGIPQGSDLNDYTTLGQYVCTTAAITETILNCPAEVGFTLTVYEPYKDGSYVMQELTEIMGYGTVRYRRLYVRTTNVWYDWYCTDGVDSIVDRGTSGIWTYRKWASGVAECWTTTTQTATGTSPTAIMGGYYSYTEVSFPFAFVTKPASAGYAKLGTGAGFLTADTYLSKATINVVGNQQNSNITYSCYFVGRWK